jgi:hypothetical protein
MYPISPCNVVTTKTITSFKIDRIEISLFKSAIITIVLLDSANSIIDVKFVNITGDDYSKWSADDSYVIDFIKQKMGFCGVETPVQPETQVQEPETPVQESETQTNE